MRVLSAVVVAAAVAVFPATSKAYTGQQFIFTRASFSNGNNCWSQGHNCHVPKPLNIGPVSQPVMMNHPPAIASTPLPPATSNSGMVSNIVSKVVSLF